MYTFLSNSDKRENFLTSNLHNIRRNLFIGYCIAFPDILFSSKAVVFSYLTLGSASGRLICVIVFMLQKSITLAENASRFDALSSFFIFREIFRV